MKPRPKAPSSKRYDSACVMCETPFNATRADHRYCGNACRVKAYQQRKTMERAKVVAELERLRRKVKRAK